jgi:hypothetical protein
MAEISYFDIRRAAQEAMGDVRGDVGRVGNDVRVLSQQIGQHTNLLTSLQNQMGHHTGLEQQIALLGNSVNAINARLDQLNGQLQNILNRLSR